MKSMRTKARSSKLQSKSEKLNIRPNMINLAKWALSSLRRTDNDKVRKPFEDIILEIARYAEKCGAAHDAAVKENERRK